MNLVILSTAPGTSVCFLSPAGSLAMAAATAARASRLASSSDFVFAEADCPSVTAAAVLIAPFVEAAFFVAGLNGMTGMMRPFFDAILSGCAAGSTFSNSAVADVPTGLDASTAGGPLSFDTCGTGVPPEVGSFTVAIGFVSVAFASSVGGEKPGGAAFELAGFGGPGGIGGCCPLCPGICDGGNGLGPI